MLSNSSVSAHEAAPGMDALIRELWPIPRSITGDGIRQTLAIIGRDLPLDVHEVPSGTPVFDWTVPKEWNVREAYITSPRGERLADFRAHNLHLVGYSVPVRTRLSLDELRPHLFSVPDHPDWIPYRTSYYKESWGFCLPDRVIQTLEDGEYEVVVDTSLEDGSLSYGEIFLEGHSSEEVLISCHSCHPSIANDNLSGIALATFLAKRVERLDRHYSYRFLFIPGTIGSLTWLAQNEAKAERIAHGLVVTCVGDRGNPTYKRSRRGDAEIDRAVEHVLAQRGAAHEINDFSPYGYDERQYCSPGFNLAVGSLMRSPNGTYPEYHTSADDLSFLSIDHLVDSYDTYVQVIDLLEKNRSYVNLQPKGEPQLGKRGLYPSIGGIGTQDPLLARLWVLNLSDGDHDLLSIAERAGMSFQLIQEAATALQDGGLLDETEPGRS